MSEHVGWFIMPSDPAEKARALRINRRRGHLPVPGISDHEMSTVMGATNPTGPMYVPHLDLPQARTEPGPVKWAQIVVPFGLAAMAGLLAAAVL